jgi:branched-subunit amino acid transport protein
VTADVWLVVVLCGSVTVLMKALGPALLGGKPLPERAMGVVALLAPAVLAALIATNTFASGRSLVIDARVAGVGAAAVALALRAPVLLVVVIAATVTAVLRAVT